MNTAEDPVQQQSAVPMKGMLEKHHGRLLHRWRPHWVELRDVTVFVADPSAKDSGLGSTRASFVLSPAWTAKPSPEHHSGHPHAFDLWEGAKARVTFAAPSATKRDEWIAALNEAALRNAPHGALRSAAFTSTFTISSGLAPLASKAEQDGDAAAFAPEATVHSESEDEAAAQLTFKRAHNEATGRGVGWEGESDEGPNAGGHSSEDGDHVVTDKAKPSGGNDGMPILDSGTVDPFLDVDIATTKEGWKVLWSETLKLKSEPFQLRVWIPPGRFHVSMGVRNPIPAPPRYVRTRCRIYLDGVEALDHLCEDVDATNVCRVKRTSDWVMSPQPMRIKKRSLLIWTAESSSPLGMVSFQIWPLILQVDEGPGPDKSRLASIRKDMPLVEQLSVQSMEDRPQPSISSVAKGSAVVGDTMVGGVASPSSEHDDALALPQPIELRRVRLWGTETDVTHKGPFQHTVENLLPGAYTLYVRRQAGGLEPPFRWAYVTAQLESAERGPLLMEDNVLMDKVRVGSGAGIASSRSKRFEVTQLCSLHITLTLNPKCKLPNLGLMVYLVHEPIPFTTKVWLYRKQVAMHAPAAIGALMMLGYVWIVLSALWNYFWHATGLTIPLIGVPVRWLLIGYSAWWGYRHRHLYGEVIESMRSSEASRMRSTISQLQNAETLGQKLRVFKHVRDRAKKKKAKRQMQRHLDQVMKEHEDEV